MNKKRTSLRCSNKFDLVFTDNGEIETVEGASSVANMLLLDFSSNDNWSLDSRLGLNWINNDNNGLMQIKNNEHMIVNEIQRKLEDTDGVFNVKEIEINKTISGAMIIKAVVIAEDGSEIEIRNEVE